jgi:hypothetical protein
LEILNRTGLKIILEGEIERRNAKNERSNKDKNAS